MKKLFTLALAVICSVSMFATDYYLQGSGVPSGWNTDLGNLSKCKLEEVSAGVYQWTGIITATTDNGFKITTGAAYGRLHPSEGLLVKINEVDQSVIRNREEGDGSDAKWIVTKSSEYTITLTEESDGKRILTCKRCITGIDIAEDGYFHVKDAASWAAFAGKLKQGVTDIDVKLDTDLTITEMLANNYCGTFDGQGHTITANLNAGGKEGGIFGIVRGGTYKNLVAEGTVRNASQAGFIGMLTSANATFENVIVKMDIEGTANVAGLVGCFDACSGKTINFKNVIFAGKAKYVGAANGNGTGGFLGWAGSGATFNLENCAMIGDVDISGQPQKSAQFIRANNGSTFKMTNCAYIPAPGLIYVNGHSSEANANATIVENATDGKLCYLLNGDQTKINFYQTLGEDNIPTINSTHKQVYASGHKHCDGSDYDDVKYNNTSGETITDEHNYNDIACTYCGDLYIAADGYFHVANKAGWDALVNKHKTGATNINVKLDADITIDDYVRATFCGTLDGQGHTITLPENLTQDFAPIGTAGVGAKFKNLNIVGDVTTNKQLSGIAWKVAGATTIENVNVNLKVNSTAILTGGYIVNCEGMTTFKNCHSTVNLYVPGNIEANFSAFICKVNTNGAFRFENCSIEGKIVVDGGWRAGGFVASDYYGVGEATFINCINNCDVLQWNGSARCGGFLGNPHESRSYVFTNCLQTGKVKRCKSNDDRTQVNNTEGFIVLNNQWNKCNNTTTNCYYTTGTEFPEGTDARQFVRTDDSALASGALCYALNGNQTNINFFQDLGEGGDDHPVLSNTKPNVLYVGDLGYCTLFTAEACELKGDAKAHKVSVSGNEAVLTPVANIPANNAVVLEGTYYNKVACANADADMTDNLLKGSATELSAEAMASANPNCLFYALSVKMGEEETKENAGFYWLVENGAAFTSAAGKGYLALPKNQANNIRGFRFGEGEEATGIESLKKEDTISGAIYNLQGQRVGANAKGIVIMNGKKVIK